jgi:hypothetical protein
MGRSQLSDTPGFSVMQRYKATAFAYLGRCPEARETIRAMLASQPEFTISSWEAKIGANAFSAPTLAMLTDGLRRAGAPE